MTDTGKTGVVAVGGNVLFAGGGPATIAEQFEAAQGLAKQVVGLVKRGWRVVLTHGNGPQVGYILRRSDLVAESAPELPQLALDMRVADSQGSLGYILGSSLQSARATAGLPQQVVAMLTHTVVDQGDPAFTHPTKPIGSFYDEWKASDLAAQHGWVVAEDSGRGWRRLASPRPIRIVEYEAIKTLAEAGFLVVAVAAGTMRVPVVPSSASGSLPWDRRPCGRGSARTRSGRPWPSAPPTRDRPPNPPATWPRRSLPASAHTSPRGGSGVRHGATGAPHRAQAARRRRGRHPQYDGARCLPMPADATGRFWFVRLARTARRASLLARRR
ncbi:hypothetical protein [Intrasporangium sp.]|uniref:amino acid kinase family protein n=1 Tax=Intrasporangium sp. TaxID=1925024 RepID=UPI0034646FD9